MIVIHVVETPPRNILPSVILSQAKDSTGNFAKQTEFFTADS